MVNSSLRPGPGEVIACLRLVLGGAALFVPGLSQRVLGLGQGKGQRPTTAADVGFRFYATRALMMGATYLLAEEDARRGLARSGLAVDLADTAFLAGMCSVGRLPALPGAISGSLTAGAALLGLIDVGRAKRSAQAAEQR